jgi:type III restriction enzyme
MQFKFSDSLPHQKEAIDAVVRLFEGQQRCGTTFEILTTCAQGQLTTETGFSNHLTLTDEELFENAQRIQSENKIESTYDDNKYKRKDFSIEMETGTGKTYVYLRTIFELSKQYGFKRFIIVVPSVAIREGVIKSIEIMHDHFKELYGNEPYEKFIYDSKKLGHLRLFSTNNFLQIMIINIQSFNKSDNIIQTESDRMGDKPIKYIQQTRPIVIIDEPQSVDTTPTGQQAIKTLNPLLTLRYSATHKNTYNLLYKLEPLDAYNKGLVKKIQVLSFIPNYHQPVYIKLLRVENKPSIKAFVEIYMDYKDEAKKKSLWVKVGDDLFNKSKKLEAYRNGFKITNINCTSNEEYVEFECNHKITLKTESEDEVIMKAQVKETIEQHLKKERAMKPQPTKIKVLSLFFIDKVSNYRIYEDDGTTSLGKIGKWFVDAYEELTGTQYPEFKVDDIEKIHNGYFSKDKKHRLKDSNGSTKDDEDAYSLIMKDKERLLDTNEPLRFIFSHSALKEGWDNPNVFQICTLNESSSFERRRQVIGRGLRLAVNNVGERIDDHNINVLTVIANESYESFAKNLQKEYEEDGVKFAERSVVNGKNRQRIDYHEEVLKSEAFITLWDKIKYKTKYKISLCTDDLIKRAKELIDNITIDPPKISIKRGLLTMDRDAGIEADPKESKDLDTSKWLVIIIPDILMRLQEKTGLTRSTIAAILKDSPKLEECKKNPDQFIRLVTNVILEVLKDEAYENIEYVKINDQYWQASNLKDEMLIDLGAIKDDTYLIEEKYKNKSLYSHVLVDSNVERKFAKDLSTFEKVNLFMKLPRWFKVNTPVGAYNPDWAFVYEDGNKLCFVAETKGSTDENDLTPREFKKFECGKKHFEALGVKCDMCTNLEEYLKKNK